MYVGYGCRKDLKLVELFSMVVEITVHVLYALDSTVLPDLTFSISGSNVEALLNI